MARVLSIVLALLVTAAVVALGKVGARRANPSP